MHNKTGNNTYTYLLYRYVYTYIVGGMLLFLVTNYHVTLSLSLYLENVSVPCPYLRVLSGHRTVRR